MTDVDVTPQPSSMGRYVARRYDKVVISADTLDELCDELDRRGAESADLVIGFEEPADVIRVY